MSFGIHGDYKKVAETRYPGRVREAALNEERADDQKRLAEMEDFVRTHRKKSRRQQDPVDLERREEPAPGKETPSGKKPAEEPPAKRGGPPPHLDVTI